jgi:hypothetical protein
MMQLPGQNPPWTPNPNATQTPPQEAPHRFPIDDPQNAPKSTKSKVDPAQLKRDADELAKLAGEIPAAVDKSSHGVMPQDLSARLKRIEKLAKQIRRDLD